MAQTVKNLSAMPEIWVRSLDWDDPLEKEMATHSSILAWRFPWTEEPSGLQSVGCKESNTTERQTLSFLLFYEKETERLKGKANKRQHTRIKEDSGNNTNAEQAVLPTGKSRIEKLEN